MLLPRTLGEAGHIGENPPTDVWIVEICLVVNQNEKYLRCQLLLFMYLFIEQKLLALRKLGALLSLLPPKIF